MLLLSTADTISTLKILTMIADGSILSINALEIDSMQFCYVVHKLYVGDIVILWHVQSCFYPLAV